MHKYTTCKSLLLQNSPMALRLSLPSSPPLYSTTSHRCYSFASTSSFITNRKGLAAISQNASERKSNSIFTVRSSNETAESGTGAVLAVAIEGKVVEVCKDSFWPIVKSAGDKVVVLDMYTQWCGPCKLIAPKYEQMAEKNLDVIFLKLDCNNDNRPLAKELGIRVVPTFKILKHGEVIQEVTGAKMDDLVLAIKTVKSTKKST